MDMWVMKDNPPKYRYVPYLIEKIVCRGCKFDDERKQMSEEEYQEMMKDFPF